MLMREAGRKGRSESLDYMQSLLGELRTMAKAERYEMLAYLIESCAELSPSGARNVACTARYRLQSNR